MGAPFDDTIGGGSERIQQRERKDKKRRQLVSYHDFITAAPLTSSSSSSSHTAPPGDTHNASLLDEEQDEGRREKGPNSPLAVNIHRDKGRSVEQRKQQSSPTAQKDKGKQLSLEDDYEYDDEKRFELTSSQPYSTTTKNPTTTTVINKSSERRGSNSSSGSRNDMAVHTSSSHQYRQISGYPRSNNRTSASPPLRGIGTNAAELSSSLLPPPPPPHSTTNTMDQTLRVTSNHSSQSARPPTRQEMLPLGAESRRYLLHILQQPSIGCAFGRNVLSRLAIAPPLIVQLQAIDRAGRDVSLEHELMFLVCRINLLDEEGNPVDMLTSTSSSSAPSPESADTAASTSTSASTSASTPASTSASAPSSTTTTTTATSVRLLYGTLVASPMLLYNQDNRPAIIFAFPEISIRSRGRFQLEVSLTRLPLPSLGPIVASTITRASTEPFNVFLSADYTAPEVTDITRHYARQGVGLLLPPEQAQVGPSAD